VGQPPGDPAPEAATSADADVHAFLIADVRGWTAFTQARGDEDAARLAGRFAEVTRAVVEDHRGRVLELRGDEALVVFGSPRSAIRGAVALQQRFVEETLTDPSLPLTVGIGLDAGEAVPVEGGYRGGALNVAARLCSLARAGEILASREIVHLALRVDGVRFTERGQAELKGLEKPVHVVAVRSEERDDAGAIAPFVRSITPPPTPWWRRKAPVGAVAFAVLAAAIAVPLLARTDGGDSGIEPNSIGVLDPRSGDVIATIALESRPGSIAASAGAVWVTNPDAGTVTRIDPNEQQIRDTIQVGENPTEIAVGFDAAWVVESGGPSVSRINLETGEVFDPIPVGNGPAGIALGQESLWVTNRFDGTVSRIPSDHGEDLPEPISVGFDPRGIAVGFGSVWVAVAGSNTVVRIDPESREPTDVIGVGNAPDALAISGDSVWVANTLDDTVSQIDPETSAVVNLVRVGDGPAQIAVVDGIVWVANELDGTLSRIEPTPTLGEASVRTVQTGSLPQGLAAVNGNLWVSVRGAATSHRGGTLRLVSNEWRPDSLDPAVSYSSHGYMLAHLMGDGLVAFEPVGGTSSAVVPDLAISLPTLADGGRTYVFELRPGIRYSNGEVVVAGDFRRALERGFRLSPLVHRSLYSGLLGAEACGRSTCDLSRGVVTEDEDGTITFHLSEPDPDFLYKLALGFAYPVPPGTPDEHQLEEGVPGTGPYMLEAPATDERVVLVRNPYFRVWSPAAQPDGYVDRIEWEWGVHEDPEDELEAIAAGEADLAFEYYGWGELDEVFVRFGAQVHADPEPGLYFLMIDTDSPPFDDVNVRRALNLAVDRELVGTIWPGGGLPTCQQIPPNFAGYQPYCPYTANPSSNGEGSWTGPDLERARRLVRRSGTSGMSIVFEHADSWIVGPPMAGHLTEVLEELGYDVTTTAVPDEELPTREFQVALYGWSHDYPAASTFFDGLLTCEAPYRPITGFCDPEIDAMIQDAKLLQLEDPAAAGALWSQIDRAIVDEAPFVWLLNPIGVAIVSERVGNFQRNFNWGILLNQLWVR
jgi:peptide/nickel transport system substrate-binding protein